MNEVILLTGAGGSIGSSLAKRLLSDARTLVLLDHSEQNLYEIHSELSTSNAQQYIPILGDVNDASLLAEVFEKYRPTQIFHAAAFKHVPLMEENPIAAIRNNILGTWTLATAAAKYRARQLTMISTDKAANPRSIMGAAKRVAEKVLTRLDTPATRMRSIRLGNVLGSTGSVVPLFQRQIANGGPVTVTHPEARRYFLSLEDATNLILDAAALEDAATLFVPDLGIPITILDLAQEINQRSSRVRSIRLKTNRDRLHRPPPRRQTLRRSSLLLRIRRANHASGTPPHHRPNSSRKIHRRRHHTDLRKSSVSRPARSPRINSFLSPRLRTERSHRRTKLDPTLRHRQSLATSCPTHARIENSEPNAFS